MTIDAQMLKKFEKMTEDLLCSICNTIMEDPHALHCGHSFCGQCILTWLKVKKACPMCRVTIIRIPTHINVLQKLADTLRPADDVPGERLNESDWLELFPSNQDASRGSRVESDGTSMSTDRVYSDFGIHDPANFILYERRRRGIEPSNDEERSEDENNTLIFGVRTPHYSDNEFPPSPTYDFATSPIYHESDNHSLSEDEAQYPPSPGYFEAPDPESDFHSGTTRSTPEFNDAMFRHDIPDDDSDDSRPQFNQDSSEDEQSNSSEHERYYSHDEQEVYHNNYSSDDEQQYSSNDDQQQYSSDDQQQYSSDEEQQQYSSAEGQQQYYSENEQQYSSEQEQQYSSGQEQHFSSDDQQQQFSSDDQPQQYSSDDQQQYSSDDQQQHYSSDEHQHQYSSEDQQQYSSDDQEQQYSFDDEPPNIYSSEDDHSNGYSSHDYNNGYSSQEDVADMDTEEDNYNHDSDYSY